MSYHDTLKETMLEGLPEFYEFIKSNGSIERYTSFSKSMTFRGYTFTAAPIKRGNLSYKAGFGEARLTVTAPLIDAMVQYIASQPVEPVRVVLYRALNSDTNENVILFKGKIRTVTIKERVANAVCESGSDILTARIPGVVHQGGCNNSLFDSGCGLDAATYRVQATISGISGADLTAAVFSGFQNTWFSGGRIRFGSDTRMITSHTGDTCSLHIPFDRVSPGSVVDVYPGCDGRPETCKQRFTNFENFLGFPCIPSVNPVVWGV